MSSLEAMDHRLTFDDILEAVQDSKRGRWFLKEFEQRLQKQDTSSILNAISKLEARMEGFAPQSGQPDEMVKVKAAIANARNDLLNMGMGKEALSAEGQLFANLAAMARKAMPTTPHEGAGVVRTLQLVAEIEKTIAPVPSEDRAAKFFSADENLFQRTAAQPKPVLVAPAPAVEVAGEPVVPVEQSKSAPIIAHTTRKEEPVATGAKLIIRKATGAAAAQVEQAEAPFSEPTAQEPRSEPALEAAPPSSMPVETPEITAIDTPRIVIIRRKAEDMPEVDAVSAA